MSLITEDELGGRSVSSVVVLKIKGDVIKTKREDVH